jgi:molecular chaperone DnaK
VESALADAKKALESNDRSQMDRARENLTKASHKLAEAMYKASASTPPPEGAPAGAGTQTPPLGGDGKAKDGGVIDAEYVDVDEKK